jgi:hypothetical protein
MPSRWTAILTAFLVASALHGDEPAETTLLLKELQSEDIKTRFEAMRGLQTSLDPRIPEACLPALKLEGSSIRRLAARAIGSRWHQIPKERVPVFTSALREHLLSTQDGLANMAKRGIELLDRSYGGPMVSRSASRRWVIYERYGLPCLIDTETMTEELLGFPTEAKMLCAYGNEELAPTVQWHPKKDRVALKIIQDRHHVTVWAWVHGKGLRQLPDKAQFLAILKTGTRIGVGFYAEVAGWTGDHLEVDLNYAVSQGEDYAEHTARLRWDPVDDQITVVTDRVGR